MPSDVIRLEIDSQNSARHFHSLYRTWLHDFWTSLYVLFIELALEDLKRHNPASIFGLDRHDIKTPNFMT